MAYPAFVEDDLSDPLDRANRKIVRILSVDGGGNRGIIALQFIVHLQEKTGLKVSDLFDLVGGTSIGASVIVGLTQPKNPDHPNSEPEYSPAELLKKACDEGEGIFKIQSFPSLSICNRENLSRYYSKFIKNQKFCDSTIPRLVFSTNLLDLSCKVFSSEDNSTHSALEVLLASTAVPIIYPPMQIAGAGIYIDGGFWYNDPTSKIIEEARKIYPNAEKFKILSLGKGAVESVYGIQTLFRFVFGPMPSISEILWRIGCFALNLQGEASRKKLAKIHKENYIRLDPIVSGHLSCFFHTNPECLWSLAKEAEKYFKNNPEMLGKLENLLRKENVDYSYRNKGNT